MGIFTIIGIGIALLAGGASYVQAKQAQKKAKKLANSMAGVLLNKESNIEPLPVIYGTRRVGGVRVFVETSGPNNEYLYMALALCEGEVGSIAGIEIDGVSRFDARFSSFAAFQTHNGSDDQSVSSLLIGAPSWTVNHRLRGVAYLSVRLKWDQNVFSGIPEITALVTGKKVYDPRTGNTTWSSNPALCIRDYLTNNRYGKGLPASAIDDDAFSDAADDCDNFTVTPYSGATSTIKLFQCNAVIDTGEEIFRNVEKMLLGCRGFLPYTNGKYALYIDQSKTHTLDLTLDNIIGGITFAGEKKEDKFNRVIVKFPNPSTKWQEDAAIWPDAGSTEESTYLGEDNNVLLVDEVEMETVTNYYSARDFARIFLLRSRNGIRVSLQATSEAINLVVGDVVRLTHPTPSFTNKPFQVEQVTLNYDGTVNLDLLEYDSTIYTYDTAAEETDYPDTDLPDPFTVAAPTGLTLTESTRTEGDGTIIPSVLVQWTAADDSFVNSYEVQYKLTTASTYKSLITGATEFDLTLPESGADYDIRVRSINSAGVRSSFVTDQVSIVGDNVAPGTPANGSTSADVHLLVVTWDNPSDSDFSYTEVKRSNDATEGNATSIAKISGESFTDGPFAVGTTRYYWLRAVDRTGNASAWVTAGNATTVAVAENDIADGAVTIDKFGTGLEPVQVVASLPGTATAGQMAFLTTDNKLYRYTGTAWITAVPLVDITGAGDLAALDTITLSYVTDSGSLAALDTITETEITDNSITTPKLNAQAVTAAKIQANTITAAQIAANTITANEIAANTITANQMAANTITSNEIAANTITAGEIAAGTITATEIAAGTITAEELAANAVTGQVFDASSYLRAGSGDNSAVMSGRSIDEYAFWAGKGFETDGGPSGADAPFRVTRDGKVIMTNFALYSQAGTKLFDSQDGLLALPQTAVAQASGALVPQVSEELTSGTETFTVTLSSTQTITANFAYPVGALFYSGTSLTDAQNNVSSAFAVTLQYSSDSGATWNTFGSTQNFSKVTSGTPTSSQYLVIANSFTVSIIYGATPTTVYVASLQSNRGAIDEGMTLVGSTSQSLAAGTYLIRMAFSATGGSGAGAPATDKTREVRLSTSGAGFTVSDGTVSDGVGTSATTGWVLQNFVEKTESDNVTINGTLTLGGDLVVNGTTTTINSTTLSVDDKNIVLADGAANAAAADGAGITIDGADTGLTYRSGWDRFHFDKSLVVGGGTANVSSQPSTAVVSGLSSFVEARINEGSSTYPQASGFVFHHVGVVTSKLEYSSTSSTSGMFGFDTDDASFGIAIDGTQFIDQDRNLSNLGTIQNGSVWINDGTAYNNYNENIRLFDPSGAAVSVIAFGASGTSGAPRNSILSYQGSNGFQFRASSTVLLKMTTSNVDSKVNLAVNGTNVINTSQELININSLSMPATHSLTKVNLYGDGSGAGDAHSIGTEPYYTIFGPTTNGWDSGLIGYKFYSNNGNLVAQLGTGASSGGNKDATFYGAVTASGVVTATGGNSTNWNTAYTYSQVGHLPLAGGSMSGSINMGANNISNLGTMDTDVKIPRDHVIQWQDGGSSYSNIIKAGLYPSEGFTGTSTFWIEYAAKGGHNFIVNTDGGSTASENTFDHFTIWQGEVDGRKLFHVTNSNGHVFSRGSFYPSNQTTNYVDSTRIANWQTAYGWGNHASEGYIGTDGTVLTTTTRVFATVQNTGTGTGDYAEMHIRNDAGTDLVFGSIGSNYSNSAWAGSRYIYSTGGDLRLKGDDNLILYSGGLTNTEKALTADTNQNVYIHKDLEIGGEINNDVFVRDGKITVKRGTGLTTTIIEDDSSAYGRAQLLLDSHYSDMIIASRNANSNSHGSTLTFATQSTSTANYRKWVIGQGQYQLDADCLAFAYGADQSNPHDVLGPQNANAMVLFDAGLTRAIFRSGVEIIQTASSFNGTVQSLRVAGASGNGSITIDANGAGQKFAYLTYAQGGVAKWEIGTDGANAGNLYINSNTQVGAASASMYLTRSGNLVGINTTDPKVRLHVSGSRAAIVSTDASYGQLRVGNTNNDETSIAFMPGLTESTIGNSSPTATRKWVMGPGAFVSGTDKFGIGNEVGSGIISFTEAGRVGIKNMAPSYMLHVGSNGSSPHVMVDGNFSATTNVGDHGRIYFNDENFGIGAGNGGTGKDDLYLWSYGGGSGRAIRFLSTTGATGGNHPSTGFYTNMVIDGDTGDVTVSRGDLTLTNGLATANNFRANGGTAEPYSGAIFSNVFRGIGTSRTVYFDGYNGSTSVWWGSGSNPHAALDSVDGTLDVWINGSNNAWRNIADFTASGLNISYGGLSRAGTQYIRGDSGHLVTQNSTTIGTRTAATAFNPNTSGISAAQCGEVRSASGTSGPGLAFHHEGVSTRWLHLQSDGVLRCVIPSNETTGGYRNAYFQAETLVCGGGPTAGNYNEGLRILDASNNYSVIAFGASGLTGAPNWSLLKNPSNYFEIRASNTVVLGSDTSGNFTARGNVTAYGSPSDIRLKENIEAIPSALEKVKALRGVTFNYKADGSRSTGLIAQDLLKVLPEVVYEHKPFGEGEARYAVRYGQIVGLLVEAIKEQQSEIDELKQLIKELINGYSKDG